MLFKINEVAKLHDISTHTLRYYEEINLVVPLRNESNYRIYTQKHMELLNIIRDLRKFDIPLEEIKDYLNHRNVEKTMKLISSQMDSISEQIDMLLFQQRMLQQRKDLLLEAGHMKDKEITLVSFPKRVLLWDKQHVVQPDDVDHGLKELHKQHEEDLSYLNQYLFGSFLMKEKSLIHSVFYVNDTLDPSHPHYKELQAGEYLCITYCGDYHVCEESMAVLSNYAKKHGYEVIGEMFELYYVDFYESSETDEYVTQIQVQVKRHE